MIEIQAPAQIAQHWHAVAPLIAPVLAITGERTAPDVLAGLYAGDAALWHLHDPGDAWVITDVLPYYQHRVAQLSIAVGKFPFEVLPEFRVRLFAWARNRGCTIVKARVRPGWRKAMPDFREEIILSYRLEPEGG